MSKGGMGSHERTGEGFSFVWLTPPTLLAKLGVFDLDPCAVSLPRPWSTARNMIALPDDGLAAQWSGRVWLNPPYSKKMGSWLKRMAEHQSGIALIFARTEVKLWTNYIWPHASSVFFISGRLKFYQPNGTIGKKSNAGGPSALIAYSDFDTQAILNSGIKGTCVRLWEIQ